MAKRRGHGEGSIHQRDDGRWCAVIDLGVINGKRKRKYLYGETRKAVQELLKAAQREQDAGVRLDATRQTVTQFLERWLTDSIRPRRRPKTTDSYAQIIRLYLVPNLGHHTLGALSPAHVQAMINALQRETGARGTPLSAQTIRNVRSVLRKALGQAVKWGLVARNVATLVDLPSVPSHQIAPLSAAQAQTLLATVRGQRLEVLYRVALSLGLRKGTAMTTAQTGYAPINGLHLYYEIHGHGEPLILLHGGFGLTGMFGAILPPLAAKRQVIAVDLQGHGRTADIDRPLSLEAMGDDVGTLIAHLGFAQADVMGYSMGGGAALQTAIQHPQRVRKLVVASLPFKRDGWYPEQRAAMNQINAGALAFLRGTPMYESYVAVAPDPAHFATLCDKMGAMMRREYDYSVGVSQLPMPVLIIAGDADGFPPAHAAAFFALLGGGQRDGSWDRTGVVTSQLAILPGTTHYEIPDAPALPALVNAFLDDVARAA